jgi:hypothetical protein
VDEERRVMERLERIGRLRAEGCPRRAVLDEVRRLLAEGEAWLATERKPGSNREETRGRRDRLDGSGKEAAVA